MKISCVENNFNRRLDDDTCMIAATPQGARGCKSLAGGI